MNRRTWLGILSCACAVLFVVASVRAGIRRSTDGAIPFPAQIVQLNSGCLWIDGTLRSGLFFEGLERKDRDGIFEYSNGGKPFVDYPESVVASIRILNNQCVSTFPGFRLGSVDSNQRRLSFEVAWKTGVRIRPALLSSEGVHCTGSSRVPESFAPPMTCEMTVDSAGTPLSDHLIVSVFGADGTRLTRLSAAP